MKDKNDCNALRKLIVLWDKWESDVELTARRQIIEARKNGPE